MTVTVNWRSDGTGGNVHEDDQLVGFIKLAQDWYEPELRDRHGIAVGPNFTDSAPPQALPDVRAKQILKPGGGTAVLGQFNASARDVAMHMDPAAIRTDIKTFLAEVKSLV
jgi:hypothetical protein